MNRMQLPIPDRIRLALAVLRGHAVMTGVRYNPAGTSIYSSPPNPDTDKFTPIDPWKRFHLWGNIVLDTPSVHKQADWYGHPSSLN